MTCITGARKVNFLPFNLGMLEYSVKPPAAESSEELLQGEKPIIIDEADLEDTDGIFTNNWMEDVISKRNARVILLQVYSHKNLLLLPIKWEGSIRKVLAEFTSISNLTYDMPIMEPAAAAGEILRRCKHLITHHGLAGRKMQQYSTPYEGFHHGHMPEFNKLVLQSTAVPQGLTITAVLNEQATTAQKEALAIELPQRTTTCGWSKKMITVTELQWPYRLSAARLVDQDNRLWSFDLEGIKEASKGLNSIHVDFDTTGFFFYPESSLDQAAVAREIKRQFGTEDKGCDLFQDFANLSKRLDYIKIDPAFHVSHVFL